MRKLVSFSFALLFACGGLVFAGSRRVTAPTDQSGSPTLGTSWAGVDYATATTVFSTSNVQLFAGEGVVYGFVSSPFAELTDYVVFRDTGNIAASRAPWNDSLTNSEVCRVYASSGNIQSNGYLGTSYRFPHPIHFRSGATARVVSNSVTIITYLFHKFGN